MNNPAREFHAHSPGGDGGPGLLRKHLESVGEQAAEFAAAFGAADIGRAAGLLHDLGKYSNEFQERVRGKNIRAPHSAFGAQLAKRLYPAWGKAVAWCVAGHHAGLADDNHEPSGLQARLSDTSIPDASAWKTDGVVLPETLSPPECLARSGASPFSLHFFIRMLFSCLVDADRLSAEKHFHLDSANLRKGRPDIAALCGKLSRRLDERFAQSAKTKVNKIRADVLRAAVAKAKSRPGFFSLSVPTGGGKTLSSLAFALNHASENGLRRVVCAIPFTSIIEQNADVFRAALGEDAVLEHHCNYEPKGGDGDPDESRLASENWDAPVVATTNVQLFESLFAARPSRCRKLHNLAGSVIVLDEVQALPANLLRPCMAALDELVENYGASVVFCTATLPDFSLLPGRDKGGDSRKVCEIAPDPKALERQLRRVVVRRESGVLTPESLANRLAETKSVLCVVNTRRQARETFEALLKKAPADECFHLSAWMHPNHRTETLNAIRRKLRSGEPCRTVATSLVEAGVDLDFPAVWRAAAGLDSVAQAAGRCNREGKRDNGEAVVFKMADDFASGEMQRQRLAAKFVANRAEQAGESLLSPDFIRMYFGRVFRDSDLDGEKMMDESVGCFTDDAFQFRDIESRFRMIVDDSVPVVVPQADAARAIVAALVEGGEKIGFWARKAQRWSASVSRTSADEMERDGRVRRIGPDRQFLVLNDPEKDYDSRVGLRL